VAFQSLYYAVHDECEFDVRQRIMDGIQGRAEYKDDIGTNIGKKSKALQHSSVISCMMKKGRTLRPAVASHLQFY
jgi:hypothetical protein